MLKVNSVNLEAALVLDISLSAMVNIMKESHWKLCVNLLLKFIIEDMEVDWLAQVYVSNFLHFILMVRERNWLTIEKSNKILAVVEWTNES